MDDGNRSRYRLVRNNSSEFPQDNEFHHRYQRRPSFVRETCRTPDAYSSRNIFRFHGQEPPSSSNWTFPNYCSRDQPGCRCSASTPKIHQADFDPRREGFLYPDRSHSPSPSIPSYYSLKAGSSRKKEAPNLLDSKTLGRHRGGNRSSLVIGSRWPPGESIKNCRSERCLTWLRGGSDCGPMEEQMKEIDMNIELLKWKKKHLESVHQQKIQSLQQGGDALPGQQPDSPPPLSDIMKPDISVDDGFESVADTCNNPLAQNFSELELELRKQQQKAKFFESILGKYKSEVEGLKQDFKKQENRHQMELEKMRTFYEKKKFEPERGLAPEPPPEEPPGQAKVRAVRPKSFKRELFPSCRGGCSGQSSEVLNLKAELMIKDQHLKKLRATLKELSSRHNELLDLHMMLVKNQSRSDRDPSGDSTRLLEDLGHVVEDVQKIFSSVGQCRAGLTTPSPATTPSGEQLSKLQQSVEKLKLEVKKRTSDGPQQQAQ